MQLIFLFNNWKLGYVSVHYFGILGLNLTSSSIPFFVEIYCLSLPTTGLQPEKFQVIKHLSEICQKSAEVQSLASLQARDEIETSSVEMTPNFLVGQN